MTVWRESSVPVKSPNGTIITSVYGIRIEPSVPARSPDGTILCTTAEISFSPSVPARSPDGTIRAGRQHPPRGPSVPARSPDGTMSMNALGSLTRPSVPARSPDGTISDSKISRTPSPSVPARSPGGKIPSPNKAPLSRGFIGESCYKTGKPKVHRDQSFCFFRKRSLKRFARQQQSCQRAISLRAVLLSAELPLPTVYSCQITKWYIYIISN